MNTFSELYKLTLEPHPEPERLDSYFQKQASISGLMVWAPGNAIPENGVRLLVSVAMYSADELRVLDIAAGVVRRSNGIRLDVFNTAQCRSQEDVNRYIPGLAPTYQTPFVGVWRDGVLAEKGSGFAGRQLIAWTLDIDPVALAPRPPAAVLPAGCR